LKPGRGPGGDSHAGITLALLVGEGGGGSDVLFESFSLDVGGAWQMSEMFFLVALCGAEWAGGPGAWVGLSS